MIALRKQFLFQMGYTKSTKKLGALNKGQLSQSDWYLFPVGNPIRLFSQQLPTFFNLKTFKNAKTERRISATNQSN